LRLQWDVKTQLQGRIAVSTADTYVGARIDSATKERAADALAAMGLSLSDAIRLLMLRVADACG
jgi:addiction module RelB/DinJ family antitoxin